MNKLKKWLIVSLLISLVSGIVVLIFTFDTGTIHGLLSIRPEYIVAAACIHGLSYLVWGVRLRGMCKTLGYKISVSRSFQIVTSSAFAASVTPSSMGGEPVRVHLLHLDKISLGKASAIVLGERLLDGIVILSFAPLSLYVFKVIMEDPGIDILLIAAALFLLGVLLLVLYAVWKPVATRKLAMFFVKWIAPFVGARTDARLEQIISKVDCELENFHGSIFMFLKKENRKGLFFGVLNTFLFWGVEFSMLYVILIGLNQYPNPLVVISAQVLMALLMAIPATPGASGIAEFGAITIFSMFVSSSLLGITVVVWRALTFYMNLLVGGFVSFRILKDTEMMKKLLR
ncbi:flippase-like domain-containing protein [Methanolobus sp.]|uniref:lysylphosphatidylglycerol synthase transmembrane domain-containing protein n=1 Tax=Methanolobus sp. TaxID=1874737 RepID=UPI0025EE5739|nr:flippase-like domain-containing protein [Methanolobus sp.]